MRPFFGARERGWLGGTAFAGLIGAHALSYLIVAPGHHHREELLHATGHGNWTTLFLLAGAAFLAALVALSNTWASPRDRDLPLGRLYRCAWTRLVPLQVVGFVGMETLERSLGHGGALAPLSERAVLLGIVLQVVVAVVCGLLLVGFTRLVRLLRTRSQKPRGQTSLLPGSSVVLAPDSVAGRPWNPRGPPLVFRSS